MRIKFKNKYGVELQGSVIGRGFYIVDAPESYEVAVDGRPYANAFIPVTECEAI